MNVKLKFLDNNTRKQIPLYATEGSAGMDLYACGNYVILSGETRVIKTGISIELPVGFELQIRSRSGLASKQNLFVLNAPGTIDSDYRGEVCVIMHNIGKFPYRINDGDRVAQGVIAKYEKVEFDVVESISDTERGSGGFGSTGIN